MQRLQIPSKYNEKLLASSFKKALLKEKKKRNMEKKKTCKDLSALHDKSFYTGGSDSKTMFDLGPNDCRWPVEDNGKVATMFCAKKAIGSYCKEHAEIAYQ